MTDRLRVMAERQIAHVQGALLRTVAILAGFSLGVFVAGTLAFSVVAVGAEIVSYALVQDDGSLRVQGKTIRLFGIYMPRTERNCRSDFSPPLCGNRSGARPKGQNSRLRALPSAGEVF